MFDASSPGFEMMKQQLRNPGAVNPRCHGYPKETVELEGEIASRYGRSGASCTGAKPDWSDGYVEGRCVTSRRGMPSQDAESSSTTSDLDITVGFVTIEFVRIGSDVPSPSVMSLKMRK